jgi:hypothetical protein
MSQLYISRSHVRKSLAWAATARAGITIATALAALALVGLSLPASRQYMWLAIATLVVAPVLVAWIVTQVLCPRMVECPACKGSLWQIGTGNLQPGRMKVKDEATKCPHCGAAII